MKNTIFLFMLVLTSCSGFLDEVDKDKLVPEKTDHFASLLLFEFNYQYPIFRSVDIMTDNVVENPKAFSSQKHGNKTTYTWQREIELDEQGKTLTSINIAWKEMYEDIAICNYVIDLVDQAIGTREEIKFIKGEAYFIRALSYFNLLNLYGQPYDPNNANLVLGVPLRDNIGVEETYSRNTVEEGYALIENDLIKACALIDSSNITRSIWHPTVSACHLLMSRVKLYQQKWEATIAEASKVIEKNSVSNMYTDRTFISTGNSEVLYSYFTANAIFSVGGTDWTAYKASPELYNLYDDNDKRKSVFFSVTDLGNGVKNYQTAKYQKDSYTSVGYTNIRVAEAYLNRAEAYVMTGKISLAMNDIRALQSKRYNTISAIVYPTDVAAALKFVLDERRKELCFEDHHRWFDLRRMNNRPEIKHKYTLVDDSGVKLGTETYTLLSNDFNYTLPIPLLERNNNPLIRNNDRYEKIPVVETEIIIP